MSAPGTNKVDLEVRSNGVAIVTLDHFPLNTLSNAVQLGIEDAAEKISQNKSIKAVVVRGAGDRAFCAGADVVDLNKKHDRYPKKRFTEYFEALNVPVVAAIQGFALGGGLELALSCHYRMIAKNGAVGLPEINIGLLPGGEGTQRLPRLVGPKLALDLMLSGQHVPAPIAQKFKVVDAVVDHKALIDSAIEFALKMAQENPTNKGRRISELECAKPEDPALFDKTRKAMMFKRKGQPAAQRIIDCVEAACNQPFMQGLETEQKLFRTLLGSPEANALQHVFFSERAAAKVPGLKAKPAKVKKIALIGSGLMAGGIAMNFAERGIHVTLVDRAQEYLDKGFAVIKANYARSVKRGSKPQAAVDKALANFKLTTSYDDIKDVDLVIEAVFEDMDLKKEIFKKLDETCKPGCILASNTSFLSIDEMASATKRPQDVIGMHFFSPANVMPLLEVVRGAKTSQQTIATAMAIGSKIGKWSVLVGNCYGFVANRMMANYGVEARNMLMEGDITIEEIDAVATEYGMPLGPFQLSDLTGLAIGVEARKKRGQFDPEKIVQDWLVDIGRLGMKTSAGWYDYSKDRKRTANKDVADRIVQTRQKLGITPRKIGKQEIFERLFFPVMNEGFKILEGGFATRPSDIDVVLVHGYNTPRYKGGIMYDADRIGLSKILATLQSLSKSNPSAEYLKPSKLLVECVEQNKTLAAFWQANSARFQAKL